METESWKTGISRQLVFWQKPSNYCNVTGNTTNIIFLADTQAILENEYRVLTLTVSENRLNIPSRTYHHEDGVRAWKYDFVTQECSVVNSPGIPGALDIPVCTGGVSELRHTQIEII